MVNGGTQNSKLFKSSEDCLGKFPRICDVLFPDLNMCRENELCFGKTRYSVICKGCRIKSVQLGEG